MRDAATMQAFETTALTRKRDRTGKPYLEFLRVLAMSGGVYRLPKGGKDSQSPHAEDEVYVVVQGRARIRVGAQDRSVQPGTIIYVPANIEHRFHDIEETLTTLVFFAPAERMPEYRVKRRSGRIRSPAKS